MGFTAMLLFDASSGVWSDSVENCPMFSQKATIYIHLYHHVEMINAKSQICFVSRCVFSTHHLPHPTSHIHPAPWPMPGRLPARGQAQHGLAVLLHLWEVAILQGLVALLQQLPCQGLAPKAPKAKACYISLGYGSSTWFIYIYLSTNMCMYIYIYIYTYIYIDR